jgi:hypothetical protein
MRHSSSFPDLNSRSSKTAKDQDQETGLRQGLASNQRSVSTQALRLLTIGKTKAHVNLCRLNMSESHAAFTQATKIASEDLSPADTTVSTSRESESLLQPQAASSVTAA